jgi:hypothetical protein
VEVNLHTCRNNDRNGKINEIKKSKQKQKPPNSPLFMTQANKAKAYAAGIRPTQLLAHRGKKRHLKINAPKKGPCANGLLCSQLRFQIYSRPDLDFYKVKNNGTRILAYLDSTATTNRLKKSPVTEIQLNLKRR